VDTFPLREADKHGKINSMFSVFFGIFTFDILDFDILDFDILDFDILDFDILDFDIETWRLSSNAVKL
jgi:hypothetical protein